MKKKILAVLLVLGMLLQVFPFWSAPGEVYAMDESRYQDAYFGGGKIINRMCYLKRIMQFGNPLNRTIEEFDALTGNVPANYRIFTEETYSYDTGMITPSASGYDCINIFDNPTSGISQSGRRVVGGELARGSKQDAILTIRVRDNPTLKRLAQGGTAYYMLTGSDSLAADMGNPDVTRMTLNSKNIDTGAPNPEDSPTQKVIGNKNFGWYPLRVDDIITMTIIAGGEGEDDVPFIALYIADIDVPEYTGNEFSTDGTVRHNDELDKDELFLKKNQSVGLTLNFNEPVFPSNAFQSSAKTGSTYNLLQTALFNNDGSDGFGEKTYYLKNVDTDYKAFTSVGSSNASTAYHMKYTVEPNDSTNNVPVDPERLVGLNSTEGNPSLVERINDAVFVDAAGNPVAVMDDASDLGALPFGSNAYPGGTYRTFIDDRLPKYSPAKNGVQPDILTGMVLRAGNKVDFDVNLNEKVVSAISTTASGIQLAFNNGMTAAYQCGSDTELWKFQTVVPDGQEAETALLETTALGHLTKPQDGSVVWDYAQNYIVDPVKSIAWANLSVDNTQPLIGYVYKNEKGSDVSLDSFIKGGSVTINASDPDLNGQPSKGIYRSGGSSGLVYYMWNRSPDNPFANESDNFAAVKRYSLAVRQPGQELYDSGYEDIKLTVANNGSTVPLPEESAGKSENWYLHTWTADMTWDSAVQLKQYDKGSAQRAEFLAENPDSTPAQQEENFRQNILPALGNYDDLNQWPLEDFKQDDSNWTYQCATVKLDNDPPALERKGVADNYTDNVRTTIAANDAISGIKDNKIQYQYVMAGETPDNAGWVEETMLDGHGEAQIGTLGNSSIENGGKYDVYVRAEDQAGNVLIQNMAQIDVLVIKNAFETKGSGFQINWGPDFTICGVPIDTLEYQYTDSSEMPLSTSWSAIGVDTRVDAQLGGETGYRYDIPADPSKNGTIYIHIKIKQKDMERYYYYYKEFKFDQLPPELTFGSNGYLYPLPLQTTAIAVRDTLVDAGGVADENVKYQWVKEEEGKTEEAPDKDSDNWKQAPSDGNVKLEVHSKTVDGNYRLYVYAKDSLGNGKIYKTSGLFAAYYLSHEPPVGSAGLIYTTGNSTDGYTAILKLEVDVPSKVGYYYSVSSNGGENWSTWRPYTNYVGVPVDSNDLGELKQNIKVKFRGYFLDNISDIYSPEINIEDAPAYALASLERIEPVRGGAKRVDGGENDGLVIDFTHNEGKMIVPTEVNPEMPEILTENQRFKVFENGNYTFKVTDGSKTAVVSIVVSNFDDIPPVATVKYSTVKTTGSNVLVSLNANEPIRVTNLDSNKKVFEQNGEVTFEFEDAVGLTGSAIAVVNNIDKTPPQAEIKLHYNSNGLKALIRYNGGTVVVDSLGYGYNASGQYTFFAVPTAENVIASNRIIAEVKPKDGAEKDYKVIGNSEKSNNETMSIRENGDIWYKLSDTAGNIITVTTSAMSTVCSVPPQVESVLMTRVDEAGAPLSEDKIVTISGKEYSKGKIRVSLQLKHSDADISENTVMVNGKPVIDFYADYMLNKQEKLVLLDRLGNRSSLPVNIAGLDNTPPEITLAKTSVTVEQNKASFDFKTDLGGYLLSDNLSEEKDLKVEISDMVLVNGQQVEKTFDISRPGKHNVKYTVTDQVGNKNYATQTVYVQASDDMFILANDVPLSPDEAETAILSTNKVTFKVYNYNVIKVGAAQTKMENEGGTFDIFYYTGLYREGQMKYIAKKVTYKQLLEGNFEIELPKAGWYTIIVRNQERERVYATMLVSRVQ